MNLKFWNKPTPYYVKPRILSEAERTRQDMERLLSLARLGENQLWKTVVSYADEFAGNEQEAALRPDMTDAQRHYNAGRAAAALDFALALRELRENAEKLARKRDG